MKRNLFIVAACLAALILVAFVGCETAGAQVLKGPIPDVIGFSRVAKTTALDTLWFTRLQNVADQDNSWDGGSGAQIETRAHLYPVKGYLPKPGKDSFTEPLLRPTLFLLYADEPFSFKGLWGTDSTSFTHTFVDTMSLEGVSAGIGHGIHLNRFPCWTLIQTGLDSLRITPASSDTVFTQGFVVKPD